MDWTNERWVRLYVRDSLTWRTWPWEAQALLPQLLRIVDRSGVLEIGEHLPLDALSAYLPKWPPEILAAGLDALQRLPSESKGSDRLPTLIHEDDRLVLTAFLAAQEAKASDAQRSRTYRARRARSDASSSSQLALPAVPENEPETTPRDAPVTSCDVDTTQSGRLSQRHAVTSHSLLSLLSVSSVCPFKADDPRGSKWPDAWQVVVWIAEARRALGVQSAPRALTEAQVKRARRPFAVGGGIGKPLTEEQRASWRLVIRRALEDVRRSGTTRDGQDRRQWLTLATLSRPENFDRFLERDELDDVVRKAEDDAAAAEEHRRGEEQRDREQRDRAQESKDAAANVLRSIEGGP